MAEHQTELRLKKFLCNAKPLNRLEGLSLHLAELRDQAELDPVSTDL